MKFDFNIENLESEEVVVEDNEDIVYESHMEFLIVIISVINHEIRAFRLMREEM